MTLWYPVSVACLLLAACGGSPDLAPGDGGTTGDACGSACANVPDLAGTGVDPTGADLGGTPDLSSGPTSCTDLVPAVPTTTGSVYHVATTGSDSNDGSSAAKAFATLGKAMHSAQPGTRILLATGTYTQTGQVAFTNIHGTAAEPIVITTETGAVPIFDFGTSSVGANVAAFYFSSSSYVFVDGITIANSKGSGIGFDASSYMTLTRSTIHDIQDNAITLIGSNFIVAGCEIYNGAMMNENGKNGTWWAGTAATWYVNGTTPTQHVQWLQNHIHDTWGECINVLFADDVDVIGNDLHDCLSGHVYMDHGANVRILRNRMYNAESKFKGPGVVVDDESYGAYAATPEDNILVANNYFGKGLAYNLLRWGVASTPLANDTWAHLHFVFNVLEANPINFDAVPGGGAPSDGVIAGNIFLGTASISFGNNSAWTLSDNVFVAGVPSQYTGNGNIKAAPAFVGPTDGSTLAGYAITNPAALAVDYRSEVPDDAFCVARSSSKTAAGLGGP